MNKDDIIKSYQQAKTIKELKAAKEQGKIAYNALTSPDQRQIKAVFDNVKEGLK